MKQREEKKYLKYRNIELKNFVEIPNKNNKGKKKKKKKNQK